MERSEVEQEVRLRYAHVEEQVLLPFQELAEESPEEAIKRLPEFFLKATRGGFFKPQGAGGTYEGVTVPLLNGIGTIYHQIGKDQRTQALCAVLEVLDRENIGLARLNVSMMHNPLLVGDVCVNRYSYWPGTSSYKHRVKECRTWSDFLGEFTEEQDGVRQFNVQSECWLGMTVANTAHSNARLRESFTFHLPELTDHLQSMIAGCIDNDAKIIASKKNHAGWMPYEESVDGQLESVAPEWHDTIRIKIAEQEWIVLPETEKYYSEAYWE